MNEETRAKALKLISELQKTWDKRTSELESLKASKKLTDEQLLNLETINADLQKRIFVLENLANSREISLEQLKQAKAEIEKDLNDYKQLLKECQRQIISLKWQRNIAVLVAIASFFL
jgi:chromosome segregation ATPase